MFHVDEEAIRAWVVGHKGGTVVWAQGFGETSGEALYLAATDALSNAIMPDGNTPEEVQQNLRALFSDLVPATERVLKFFDRAITGYLVSAGAEMTSGDVPNEQPGQAQGPDNE